MNRKPVILYTTPVLAHPPIGGPELRVENSIKALSRVADVVLYCRRSKETIGGDAADQFYKQYCREVHYLQDSSFLGRVYYKMLSIALNAAGVGRGAQWNNKWRLMKDMKRVVHEISPNILWFGYGNLSYAEIAYFNKHLNIPIVCDTDSVWSRFVGRELPLIKDPVRRAEIEREVCRREQEERGFTQLADITTAVSAVDQEYYAKLVADKTRVMIFSNVIDADSYQSAPAKASDLESPSVYIAGSFFAPGCAMEHATRWFIGDVLPILKRKVPAVKIYIVGKGSDFLLKDINDPAVIIKGFVPSVLPYLCHVSVVAVPLWFESGTRFKILEAGACRKAVVSTTLGAEGIPVSAGKDILIADEPEQFAEAVAKTLNDPAFAGQLADGLYHLIQDQFGMASHAREAESIICRILRTS